ncbi:MAG: Gfo/Idh/MocA family oxidoreductase [Erythrobacter sp.]
MSLRWGIVGYGWVARDYMAPGIRASGGEVAAVCDPSPEARALAEASGARAFSDLAEMLDAGDIDALYIATPNHFHADAIEAASRHGIAILCEKPLAQDGDGVERIARIAQGSSARIGTAFDQRHHPAHAVIRDHIAAGDLGIVTAIRIVYCCWVDPDWSRGTGDNWRAEPGCAGGGAVLDLAPHGLDLAHFLCGEPVERVAMTLQGRVHDYAVEDGGMIMGRTPSGILFSSHTSYNWPEELPRRRLEIAGTEAMIVATDTMGQDAGGHMTRIGAKDASSRALDFDTDTTPFARQAAAFAEHVREPGDTFSITRDIVAARAFFAAYEEARKCP